MELSNKQKRAQTPQGNTKKKLFKSNSTDDLNTGNIYCNLTDENAAEIEGISDIDNAGTAGGVDDQIKALLLGFKNFEIRMDKRLDNLFQVVETVKSELEFHKKQSNDKIESLEKEIEEMKDKLDDLENRSRRNNLIFFGVPEGEEKGQSMNEYMEGFIQQIDPTLKLDIQRSHRTPTGPRPEQGQNPRPIHVAFTSFTTKEAVKKSCIKKFKESRNQRKLFVDDDLSKRIRAKRKKLLPQVQELRKAGKRAFFAYPAIIKYYEGDRLMTKAK